MDVQRTARAAVVVGIDLDDKGGVLGCTLNAKGVTGTVPDILNLAVVTVDGFRMCRKGY
jgi:hypothetical protein